MKTLLFVLVVIVLLFGESQALSLCGIDSGFIDRLDSSHNTFWALALFALVAANYTALALINKRIFR